MQMTSKGEVKDPFLALDGENKLCLFPLMFLRKEPPSPKSSSMWMDIPHISTESGCPREKWIHIGCEVCCIITVSLGYVINQRP